MEPKNTEYLDDSSRSKGVEIGVRSVGKNRLVAAPQHVSVVPSLGGLLDASSEYAIVATDLQGKVLIWNDGAQRIYGYSREEAFGMDLRGFQAAPEGPSGDFDAVLALVLVRGRWEGISNRKTKDGGVLATRTVLTVWRNETDAALGFLSISRDISEETRVYATLQDPEAHDRGMVESTSDSLFTTDLEGKITDANQEMERLSERPRGELIGTRFRDLVSPPEAADEVVRRVLSERRVIDINLTLRQPFGATKDILYNATTFEGQAAAAGGIIANIRDVTSTNQSRHQLEEESASLKRQNERVVGASRLKSEFVANMSHELRTPLITIIGFSEMMLTARNDRLEAEQREFLTDILNSGQHLLGLINEVLEIAKLDSGKFRLRPARFALRGAIESVAASFLPQLREREVSLHTEIDPELHDVTLDPMRFKQILVNLVSNAIKFTPAGGHVEVTAVRFGDTEFALSVRDTGIGISASDLSRLFVEYEQLSSRPDPATPGTGLGLSLTRKFVSLMGGSVEVQSELGHGSTFTVHLPMVDRSGSEDGAGETTPLA
jgi:PAS domain S-box-containing protein